MQTHHRRPGAEAPPSRFLVGLDLSQASDFTAISVTEAVEVLTGRPPQPRLGFLAFGGATTTAPPKGVVEVATEYHVRHLERPQLGTPYPEIVARAVELVRSPALDGRARLVVDATGVGRPVVDMLAAAGVLDLVRVTIHGGDTVTGSGSDFRVPKRELAGTLQALLQSGRLKFAGRLPLADVLIRELQAFKVKINVATGHDSYEAWREGDHDDLVLSLAIAVWFGEYAPALDFTRL